MGVLRLCKCLTAERVRMQVQIFIFCGKIRFFRIDPADNALRVNPVNRLKTWIVGVIELCEF